MDSEYNIQQKFTETDFVCVPSFHTYLYINKTRPKISGIKTI